MHSFNSQTHRQEQHRGIMSEHHILDGDRDSAALLVHDASLSVFRRYASECGCWCITISARQLRH